MQKIANRTEKSREKKLEEQVLTHPLAPYVLNSMRINI